MKRLCLATVVLAFGISVEAKSEEMSVLPVDSWFVHVGASGILFDSKLQSSVGLFPGSDATVNNAITPSFELGYYLNRNISISLSSGLPVTTNIDAIAPAFLAGNNVTQVTMGSVVLGAQYHLDTGSALRPYAGAGIAYNFVTSQTPNPLVLPGGVLDNSFGAVLQIGADLDLTDHVGVFVDVKKMVSTAHFSGAGGVDGQLQLNPLIVSTGLSLRF
ncbi:MAG: OmpW family protein [Alphaproteobacteria bacterium]|nr:OmpW family protein [Alphaproteobacteria bacterium]